MAKIPYAGTPKTGSGKSYRKNIARTVTPVTNDPAERAIIDEIAILQLQHINALKAKRRLLSKLAELRSRFYACVTHTKQEKDNA